MTNEIAKKEVSALEPTTWMAMKEQCQMLVRSGFLPVAINTPEKALAVALAGRELGVGMMESFRSINVIQGKPTVSPQLMLALANRTKELENIDVNATDEKCVVTVTRKGRKPVTTEFGIKEATDLGLMSKDNYKKQKKTMFQWRCLAANLRVTFPDVVLGLYTPEELGAEVQVTENENMEVIETKAVDIQQKDVNGVGAEKTPPVTIESIFDVPHEFKTKQGKPFWKTMDGEGVNYYIFDKVVSDYMKQKAGQMMSADVEYTPKGNRITGFRDIPA